VTNSELDDVLRGTDDATATSPGEGATARSQVEGGGVSASRRGAGLCRRWVWPALVVVLFCLPLFVGLGRTDFENDEAFHSLIVETMVKTGDWLTPGNAIQSPFLEKPPLKFWMVAAPIRLGLLPNNEFGMRFCDVIITTVAFLYVLAIGRRLSGSLCGLAAVMILFAHQPLLFDHGLRSNNMEAALLLSYCGGACHFLAWTAEAGPSRRRRHIFAMALYFVLGFMVKFVAVVFLPLVLGVVTLFSPEARSRLRSDWRAWLGAGALALALIAPWFLYQFHQFGTEVWRVIFGQQVMTRFTAYLDPNHLHPWHFYWSSILHELSMSGALTVAAAGLVLLLRQTVRYRSRDAGLILLWFALPLVLMSLMTSKLYHYAYPYLPPLALAGGYAAAVVVRLAWSLAGWSSGRLNGVLGQRLPAILRSRAVRLSFLAVAVAAIGVAIATHAAGGRLRLAAGDVVLLRNTSALRAWLIAVLMLVLAGRVGSALRVGFVAVVVVLLWPVSGYTQSLARLPVQRHPLRSIGQCLQAAATHARPGDVAPGIWVEAESLAHFHFYYLRGLGPWHERREGGSDPTVYMHLYVPSMRTPVLLSVARHEEFVRATRTREPELLERVARETGLDVATLKADADRAYTTVVRFPNQVLILPGPFSVCAVEYASGAGGR
jgi:4-amino-4-deoxy-L-arabinose transferase-like glycosyltransferase